MNTKFRDDYKRVSGLLRKGVDVKVISHVLSAFEVDYIFNAMTVARWDHEERNRAYNGLYHAAYSNWQYKRITRLVENEIFITDFLPDKKTAEEACVRFCNRLIDACYERLNASNPANYRSNLLDHQCWPAEFDLRSTLAAWVKDTDKRMKIAQMIECYLARFSALATNAVPKQYHQWQHNRRGTRFVKEAR